MPLEVTAKFDVSQDTGRTDWSLSRQWASRPKDQRFVTLEEMRTMLDARSAKSSTIDLPIGRIRPELDSDGELGFEAEGKLFRPTNYSFQQLCRSIDVPSFFLTNTLKDAPWLVAENLRYGVKAHPDQDKDVQFYVSGDNLRAVTGPNYGRIEDREVLRAAMEAFAESGCNWQVPTAFARPGTPYKCIDPSLEETTLYASDRDMYLCLVDQENPIEAGFITDPRTGARIPDLYSRGVIIKHGECGDRKGEIWSFLYRWICCNRSIREQKLLQKLSWRHTANVRDHFHSNVVPALQAFVNGSAAGVAGAIKSAREATVVRTVEESIPWMVETLKISADKATEVARIGLEEEGRPIETLYDVVQAVSAFARRMPHQDERVLVERQVGRLLDKVAA
jgi:hypothetical protein